MFIDEKQDGYSYNPVNDDLYKLPDLPAKVTGVIWDSSSQDNHVLVAFNEEVGTSDIVYITAYILRSSDKL